MHPGSYLEMQPKRIEIPAIYHEFPRQTSCIYDGRRNRSDFLCAFGGVNPPSEKQAEPLEGLKVKSLAVDYDVAAGFIAGQNVVLQQRSHICYLLCRPQKRPEAENSWSWKIFVGISDDGTEVDFDSFTKFLDWYSGVCDRTHWASVKRSIQRSFTKIEQEIQELREIEEDEREEREWEEEQKRKKDSDDQMASKNRIVCSRAIKLTKEMMFSSENDLRLHMLASHVENRGPEMHDIDPGPLRMMKNRRMSRA